MSIYRHFDSFCDLKEITHTKSILVQTKCTTKLLMRIKWFFTECGLLIAWESDLERLVDTEPISRISENLWKYWHDWKLCARFWNQSILVETKCTTKLLIWEMCFRGVSNTLLMNSLLTLHNCCKKMKKIHWHWWKLSAEFRT